MKISSVKYWKEDLQLTRPYTIAYKTVSAVENVFVLLELQDGRYGIGAGSPASFVTGESIDDTIEALDHHLESLVYGKDIRHFHEILQKSKTAFTGRPAAQAALYDVERFLALML